MPQKTSWRWLAITMCIVGCICGIIIFTAQAPFHAKASATGSFTVQGNKIYDPNGNEFVIKGTNINGPNWVWPFEMTQYADVIATSWRFNFVRVNAILKGDNFHDNDDLDRIVDAFTSRGVVVMFEAHDWTGSVPSGEDLTLLTNWHTDLANRYKDNTYVWFNIYNEPFYCQSPVPQEWLTVHQTVISAIRTTGANNIVVAEGHNFGSDQGCNGDEPVPTNMSALLTYGPTLTSQFANVAFSLHFYCWGDYYKMSDLLDRIATANLAVFIGEFGVAGGGDCNSQPTTEAMYSVIVPRNIGRVVWHFYGGDGNKLTDTPNPSGGWKIDDPVNPTNLTWLGQQVWNDTHGTLTLPPTPTPYPTATPTVPGTGLGVNIDDRTLGTDLYQFNYVGSWDRCSDCDPTNFGGGNSWNLGTADDSVSLTFRGTKIEFWGILAPHHGLVAISIDGGPETTVDMYAPRRHNNQMLWSSPLLSAGTHTFTLRVTGTKNAASSGAVVNIDRVNITIPDQYFKPVHPVLDCVQNNNDGTYTAYFGYKNDNAFTVELPVGTQNRFHPNPQARGQIISFVPGRSPYKQGFTVPFDGNPLVWTLKGRTSTASTQSKPC